VAKGRTPEYAVSGPTHPCLKLGDHMGRFAGVGLFWFAPLEMHYSPFFWFCCANICFVVHWFSMLHVLGSIHPIFAATT
jgi:hypothetical protein